MCAMIEKLRMFRCMEASARAFQAPAKRLL